MTPQQISQDIERGIELRTSIKNSKVELKQIESRLEQAGLEGDQIPLQEPDREGRQFLARCPKLGVIIPVVFESDQIIASLLPGTPAHQDIARHAGTHFSKFWKPVSLFMRLQKEGQDYRKAAREILDSTAPDFIAASLQRDKEGIPKSRTVIAWDNSRDINHVPA